MTQEEGKSALRVIPLKKGDLLPNGKPLEWGDLPLGLGGFGNPNVGTCNVHVLLERERPVGPPAQYDQQVTVEGLGVITVVLCGKRVALIEHDRPIGRRLPDLDPKNYPLEALRDEETIVRVFASLGAKSWETMRGYAKPLAEALRQERGKAASKGRVLDEDEFKLILEAAAREVLEESGLTVKDARVFFGINQNTTFCAYPQPVVVAEVDESKGVGGQSLEEREFIGVMRLFTPEEVRQLVAEGQLTCGWTLSALAIAGFHF